MRFLVENVTYLLINLPRAGALVKDFCFRLEKLPRALPHLAPGGKARAFADIVGDRLGQSEQRQFQNLAQTLIPYATGDSLDLLGEIYGVPRLGRRVCSPTSPTRTSSSTLSVALSEI